MILRQGEDVIACTDASRRDLQALAKVFRSSGIWEEVVPGMADLTVKFDPLAMSTEQAEAHFQTLWNTSLVADPSLASESVFDADFREAPDTGSVASALGIAPRDFPDWLTARRYRVTMMGFQPGFPYLEDLDSGGLPRLPRLSTPRPHVEAGSIGLLGKRACIYALEGPGGWPIVGRVREPIFQRDRAQPFRLQPGQIVRFRSS
jgi:KipI family sensor histidine kinase inhibitor